MVPKDKNYLAIDPGSDKCGLAVVGNNRKILIRVIVTRASLIDTVREWLAQFHIAKVLLGNGTTSAKTAALLKTEFPMLSLVVVNEYRTTDMARKLYWRFCPPRGWRKFVPQGFLVPPGPVDDFAAVAIAYRYLDKLK